MSEDPWFDELRALPRERASAGFTAAVLARLPGRQPSRPSARWVLFAAAGALVAVVLGLGWWSWEVTRLERRSQRELAQLQQELERLRGEWETLRRRSRSDEPVVFIGGDDRVDFVLDLRRVPAAAVSVEPQPAALEARRPR